MVLADAAKSDKNSHKGISHDEVCDCKAITRGVSANRGAGIRLQNESPRNDQGANSHKGRVLRFMHDDADTQSGHLSLPFEVPVLRLQTVPSYGVHRFSNVTRITLAFIAAAVIAVTVTLLIVLALLVPSGITIGFEDVVAVIVGAFIAAIIATIIARIFAHGIIVPLKHISETVNSYSLDNLNARTGFTGFDEIGRLGRSIDEMADKLAKAHKYERQITVDLAHELRTPLMSTQATLEAMIDKVMPSDEERLQTVHSEIVRLSRLVEAQLELSRLESRRIVVNAVKLDLSVEIKQLVLSFESLIEDAGLSLTMSIKDAVFVRADPDLIRQAMTNLISNAVRHTASGGSLEVTVERVGSKAQIAVKDTGIGISNGNLEKIFVKFYRVDEGRSRDSGGLGIGLALIKEIVDIHEGRINVRSELGKGSIFTIELPLYESKQVAESTLLHTQKAAQSAKPKSAQSNKRDSVD